MTTVNVTKGGITTSQAKYAYDLVGNRLSETKDGEATSYVYNSLNQLISSATQTVVDEGLTPVGLENKTYTYDLNGSQIQVADSITHKTQESTFDAAGRLSTYVDKENGTVTLTQENAYNGADQRIKKTEIAGSNPADVVNYYYQDGEVLYTTGSEESCAFNILGAGDNIIATEHQDANELAAYHFYNKDLMGSTTNILGSTLTSEVTYDYDWFGNTEITNPEGSDFYNQICYTGGMYDESTKLYYLNARFYNPDDGRFLSQDTYRGIIEDANSWHLYAYCANNPVKYSDPSGHFIWFAIGAAMAIHDGYKAYKKAKKQGKSGWSMVKSVAKSAVISVAFGKIGKAYKATKKIYKIGKKVFKSKPLKKLYGKTKKYKGKPKKITISKAANGKKKAPSLGSKKKTHSAHGSNYRNTNQSNIVGNKDGGKLSFDKQKKGTPGNNRAQNKQVRDVVNKLKLNKEQQRKLHDEISGQNYGFQEILETAKDMFGK